MMFPMNLDGFQFAFYGFATLASVGYAWRRSVTSRTPLETLNTTVDKTDTQCSQSPLQQQPCALSTPNSASQTKSTPEPQSQQSEIIQPTSHKRKYSEDDVSLQEQDPDPSSIYPNKRSKTPSDTDSELVRTPLADESLTLEVPSTLLKQNESMATSKDVCQQTESEHSGGDGLILPLSEPAYHTAIQVPRSPASHASPPNTRPGTPSVKAVTQSKAITTGGFASFANVDSSFRTTKVATVSPTSKEWSIWQGKVAPATLDNVDPLAAEPVLQTTYSHLTGEENETVELELKGLKLYTKHGSRDFTDGLIGHIKLLSSKNSESERLLFRREPLWQVSMNMRLNPLVRCSFDEENYALRLITKEPVERANTPVEQWPQEIVIYVVKRGRVPKEAFRHFVDTLLASKHLQRAAS